MRLARPNFEKVFIIYTNAIEEAISSILLQIDDQNIENTISHESKFV